MIIIETELLILKELTVEDAPFILSLLNEPSFILNIGDKGVRDIEGAEKYILNGPVDSYHKNGFGLYLVALKSTQEPIGISGLVKRPALDDADIGFAFLPAYWSKGYAVESAQGVMHYGKEILKLKRILGITSIDNYGSIKVLEKVGLKFEKLIRLSENDPEINLFVWQE